MEGSLFLSKSVEEGKPGQWHLRDHFSADERLVSHVTLAGCGYTPCWTARCGPGCAVPAKTGGFQVGLF